METKAQMMKMLNLSAISKERKLEIFLYAVAAIVILGVYFYYNRQITKKNTEITTMTDTLAKIPMQMAGINGLDTMYQYRLRDYYIASSYNSCCAGQFLDDYVSLEALSNVLKKGARLVDFEIYSFGGKSKLLSLQVQVQTMILRELIIVFP